jgi:dephospho-CoA kinase
VSTFKVGLTGGIGSGKTTVAQLFQSLGIVIIDADVIAREVVQPGMPTLQEITAHFGVEVLFPNGNLNREALRRIILQNPKEKIWLENLMHPRIVHILNQRASEAASPYCIVVIPLLVETDLPYALDRVLVVDVTEALQKERLLTRLSLKASEIDQFIAAQASREDRLACADDVITNTGTLDSLKSQVNQLHKFYLSMVPGTV